MTPEPPARESPTSRENIQEYSVSELSQALKRTVESGFSHVRVRGEISGLARPRSGHVYLALKDENAVIDAVCWRGVAARLGFVLEDGLEVVCTGKLSTYPARSKYQLIIDTMAPAGAGALMALLEERKKKLAAEGLFDPARKRDIPYLPTVIGVVTSPTGAVIRDILHRLADRFARPVLLWPVKVQGEGAAAEIATAIRGFNRIDGAHGLPRPDLLIVARGGGSLEDLWAFNEEIVVRAAAASDIPLISAVGHETDNTLIDLAADRRAPTPTAAAEMAVPVRADLVYTVGDLAGRLGQAMARGLEQRRAALAGLSRGLPRPRDLLGLASQRVDDLAQRLPRALLANAALHGRRLERAAAGLRPAALSAHLQRARQSLADQTRRLTGAHDHLIAESRQQLTALARLFDSLNYKRVLERGFAVVHDHAGRPVGAAAALHAGEPVGIEFHDGTVDAVVGPGGRPARRKSPPKSDPDTPQGRLF